MLCILSVMSWLVISAFSFKRFLSNVGRRGCVSKDRNKLKEVGPFLVTLEAGN
ncbi:hypothetical protein KC19_VG332900 [Ceratodon purpureus]|uniref:Uncharacterized protein n=1 Tax=Ceratodon purpureus TaxID=3225 RepID=A0A8T0HY33_CERPU|nr:hypothetical protein KC19_VG332900 [Ceratodon purpureus]